ncbi:DgyrCDS834 [Dimorphilus gyrociliatus]|uniref:DgyrCDS834 n=1 Tax=Dimorphilus gyrociliatus TaxID=2664684 RepID=A0A7I8V5I0_9ANNE|nr:DgyrCDS834 [Dimorphilus gyrociliatus]
MSRPNKQVINSINLPKVRVEPVCCNLQTHKFTKQEQYNTNNIIGDCVPAVSPSPTPIINCLQQFNSPAGGGTVHCERCVDGKEVVGNTTYASVAVCKNNCLFGGAAAGCLIADAGKMMEDETIDTIITVDFAALASGNCK